MNVTLYVLGNAQWSIKLDAGGYGLLLTSYCLYDVISFWIRSYIVSSQQL